MASRKKKEPKTDLHLTINPLVADYFDALRPVHGREYSEFCEEKLLALIAEFAPEKALEIQLDIAEKRVLEIKKAISDVKLLRSLEYGKLNAKQDDAKKQKEEESRLKAHRETMFLKYRKTLEYQKENRLQHDWNKIQEEFRFKNKSEAMDYISSMMN